MTRKKEPRSENQRWNVWTYSWVWRIVAVILLLFGSNLHAGDITDAIYIVCAIVVLALVWAVRTITNALFSLLDEMEKFNEE